MAPMVTVYGNCLNLGDGLWDLDPYAIEDLGARIHADIRFVTRELDSYIRQTERESAVYVDPFLKQVEGPQTSFMPYLTIFLLNENDKFTTIVLKKKNSERWSYRMVSNYDFIKKIQELAGS